MPSRWERLIFYLFVFCIPFEKRLIIANWLPFQSGGVAVFNEWTSTFIYVSDLLLLTVLILWLWRWLSSGRQSMRFSRADVCLGALAICAGLSIFRAPLVPIALFRYFRLFEYISLYFYIKYNFKSFELGKLLMIFIGSALLQGVIGIAQVARQGAVGLKLFGESPLKLDSPGVAVFLVRGVKYLRAYGTTPHPNVLAFVLFAGLLCCLVYRIQAGKQLSSTRSAMLLCVYGVLGWSLLLTFSRTNIAVSVLCLAPFFWMPRLRSKLRYFAGVSFLIAVLFCVSYWPQVTARTALTYQDEAVQDRLIYNRLALVEARQHFLFGDGIGQSVPSMMQRFPGYPLQVYQPTHNVYLLVASEVGILGLLALAGFIFYIHFDFLRQTNLRPVRSWLLITSLGLFIIGLLDHFLWTLQQGSLLIWLYFGLLGAYGFSDEDMLK